MDSKTRLWEDVKRCREAQLDQAICFTSLLLLALFPTLQRLALSDCNQAYFERSYYQNCAKRALAVSSNIAIKQILQSPYISMPLSLWLRVRGLRVIFNIFSYSFYVSAHCFHYALFFFLSPTILLCPSPSSSCWFPILSFPSPRLLCIFLALFVFASSELL